MGTTLNGECVAIRQQRDRPTLFFRDTGGGTDRRQPGLGTITGDEAVLSNKVGKSRLEPDCPGCPSTLNMGPMTRENGPLATRSEASCFGVAQ